MEFIEAKTILQRATHGEEWFGIDYNMNLYKGCCHKCIYCDSRSNCYQVENFDRVRAKKDEIEILNSKMLKPNVQVKSKTVDLLLKDKDAIENS